MHPEAPPRRRDGRLEHGRRRQYEEPEHAMITEYSEPVDAEHRVESKIITAVTLAEHGVRRCFGRGRQGSGRARVVGMRVEPPSASLKRVGWQTHAPSTGGLATRTFR